MLIWTQMSFRHKLAHLKNVKGLLNFFFASPIKKGNWNNIIYDLFEILSRIAFECRLASLQAIWIEY